MLSIFPFQHFVFPGVQSLFVCSGTSTQKNSFTLKVFPECLKLLSLVPGIPLVSSLELWLCFDLDLRSSVWYAALIINWRFLPSSGLLLLGLRSSFILSQSQFQQLLWSLIRKSTWERVVYETFRVWKVTENTVLGWTSFFLGI